MLRRSAAVLVVAAITTVLIVTAPWSSTSHTPAQTAAAIAAPAPLGAAQAGPTTPPAASAALSADGARRDRFGAIVVDGVPGQVTTLGLDWYIPNAFAEDEDAPPGTHAVRFFPINPVMDPDAVSDRVNRYPGSYWLIGNEPNVPDMTYGGVDPDIYAGALNYYANVIKAADPTAKLVGPNVLNWSFVCDGCSGYPQGQAWTEAMRSTYLDRYGAQPPLDVWSLHTYELDWNHFPNGNAQRDIDQITGFRTWLDATPELAGAEIWVTEMGIHWGYQGLEWKGDVAYPLGSFDYAHVEAYMQQLFGWLNDNAGALNVQKWFLFPIFSDHPEPYQSKWTGITLMDGPEADAPINRLGRLYQQLAGVQ